MTRKKKEQSPSNNFCILCGRHTNDRKFPSESWTNQFFVCIECKKVWCGACMGQVSGLGPGKTFRSGKKGKINCPDCSKLVAMAKLPGNLTFIQRKSQDLSSDNSQVHLSKNFCSFCGEKILSNASFCHVCGTKQ